MACWIEAAPRRTFHRPRKCETGSLVSLQHATEQRSNDGKGDVHCLTLSDMSRAEKPWLARSLLASVGKAYELVIDSISPAPKVRLSPSCCLHAAVGQTLLKHACLIGRIPAFFFANRLQKIVGVLVTGRLSTALLALGFA